MAKKDHDDKQKTVPVTVKNVSGDKQFTMPQPAPPPPKHFSAGATGYVATSKADLDKQKERDEQQKQGKTDEPLFDLAPDEEKMVEVPAEQMHLIVPTLEDAQMRGFIQWSAPGHVSGRPGFGLPGGTVVAQAHQHAGEVALADQKKAETQR
jgi:hypothetical protein